MDMRNRLFVLVALLAATLGASAPASLHGIDLGALATNSIVAAPHSAPQTYGTSDSVVYTLWSTDFTLLPDGTSAEGMANGSNGARRCGNANCIFVANAHLPAGAMISGAELEACDASATGQVAFVVLHGVAPGQNIEFLSVPSGTGGPDTPGCALFPVLTLPTVVVNSTGTYAVDVNLPADAALSFNAVRLIYNLQVSPAPATATFGDVPTSHPFFQFIEALASAGITGGCGSGNYCPDAPLTRGQMAVFLAKALGLHFPN